MKGWSRSHLEIRFQIDEVLIYGDRALAPMNGIRWMGMDERAVSDDIAPLLTGQLLHGWRWWEDEGVDKEADRHAEDRAQNAPKQEDRSHPPHPAILDTELMEG